MAIPPVTPSNAYGTAQAQTPARTSSQQQKLELNASILEANRASFNVTNQPLSLLFSTAIAKLNEILAPTLGENAIQNAAASGTDFSPEATAQRIVSLSTGFYSAFKAQHPNESDAAVQEKFMATISEGVDRGFNEAKTILSGLNVLQGSIADNIDKTYSLVQDGLNAFKAQFANQSA